MNLVVESNRLPYTLAQGEGGEWKVERGSGADWMVYFWRENI